jgi:4-hydroxy-3-methylbut-2-enyl diphosphate reductase
MKLHRASHLGWCFGVRDAVRDAKLAATSGPVTILGELVHNPAVIEDLRQRGILTRHDPTDVTTQRVLITAHGASRRRMNALRELGLEVTETTCPLVHKAHAALDSLVRRGCHPVIIGQRNHVEVRGLAEDHPECDVVLSEAEIDALTPRPVFGVVSQTTQPIARVRELVQYLRTRFPDSLVHFRDTVCQPTKDRQQAAEDLAAVSTVVVVVGGRHSNNTRQLAATCGRFCARVHHVESAGELCPDWFNDEDRVGLTAGTSTPDDAIEAVETRLREIAASCANGQTAHSAAS